MVKIFKLNPELAKEFGDFVSCSKNLKTEKGSSFCLGFYFGNINLFFTEGSDSHLRALLIIKELKDNKAIDKKIESQVRVLKMVREYDKDVFGEYGRPSLDFKVY